MIDIAEQQELKHYIHKYQDINSSILEIEKQQEELKKLFTDLCSKLGTLRDEEQQFLNSLSEKYNKTFTMAELISFVS